MNQTPKTTLTITRRKKLGRPSRYRAARARILAAIGRGMPHGMAAQAAGVAISTFHLWRTERPQFQEQVQRAMARGLESRLRVIEKAARTDWRAAAWYAEHVHPDFFAKNRIEISGPNGSPLAGAVALYLPQKQTNGELERVPVTVNPPRLIENETL